MNNLFLNSILDNGNPVTLIGLVDDTGTEITGGSPAYARKPVTWTAASAGDVFLSADIVFDIPAGVTVAGWRGYSALTAGTDYGGASLAPVLFDIQGQYTLVATGTGIDLN